MGTFLKTMSENQKYSSYKYKCDRCDKKFTVPSKLKRHIDSVHLKVKFNCEICSAPFARKGHLKTHIDAVHLNLKPFQCDECDYSCARGSDLKKHVDSVHKKIRFHCSFDGCDKSFSQKTSLAQHLKLHEGH